ncbi:MAG: radical SAM protein [Bryobacteraceae bacterium]|jgi:radical SAM superfamily enzyme YgiQ (UPF0313 family)
MSEPVEFILVHPPANIDMCTAAPAIPLGGLYLADALLKQGFSVAILDDSIERARSRLRHLVGRRTIAIGISTLSGVQLRNALSVAGSIRQDYPGIPIIWGGSHVTAVPQQTLESELVDYVVWGEGEESLPRLLSSIRRGDDGLPDINGIGYKMNGRHFLNPASGYTPLNDSFHLPYHLLDMDRYARKLRIGPQRCFSIFSSRGCPFHCRFCSNTSRTWSNRRMRYHPIAHVLGDISALVEQYRADGITFGDENFFVHEKRVVEICEALVAARFDVAFRAAGRADLLSRLKDSTWKLLKDAGFVGIAVGIESGSQRMLDIMGKGTTLAQVRRTDQLLTNYGFYKTYNFLTCVPGEGVDDVKATLNLIVELARTSYTSPYPFGTLHKYIPLPGTELYDVAIQHGLMPPMSVNGWASFDFVDFMEASRVVRPWLGDQMLRFVNRANELIEDLNRSFIGSQTDMYDVSRKITAIEECAAG